MTKSDKMTSMRDFVGFLRTLHAVNQYSIVSNGKGMLNVTLIANHVIQVKPKLSLAPMFGH